MKATNEALNEGISAAKPGNTADDVAQKFGEFLINIILKKSLEQDIQLELDILLIGVNIL